LALGVSFSAVPSMVKLALSVLPVPETRLKVWAAPASGSPLVLRVPMVALAALFRPGYCC